MSSERAQSVLVWIDAIWHDEEEFGRRFVKKLDRRFERQGLVGYEPFEAANRARRRKAMKGIVG